MDSRITDNKQQISIQSEINRIKRNLKQLEETNQNTVNPNKDYLQSRVQKVEGQYKAFKNEFFLFYEDVKLTFMDIK